MAAAEGRYARAFADVVMAQKFDPSRAMDELSSFAELIHANHELRNVLENPSVEHTQKLALLDALTRRMKSSQIVRNFVAVLIGHRRIGQIHDIAEECRRELNRRFGVAEAVVQSAREMSSREKRELEARMAAVTGMTVHATYSQDPGLLGGVVVRIGSTVYDGSVLGQLKKMKEEIVAN